MDAIKSERIQTEFDPVLQAMVEDAGTIAIGGTGVGTAFNMLNPEVILFLESYAGDRIDDLIDETTKNALRLTLEEGVALGEGIQDLKNRIFDTFLEGQMDIYSVRAERIARTEVGRAQNFATLNGWKQSGVIPYKQWIAQLINSRPEHEAAHMQIVESSKPFNVGGELGMYPGDFPSAWNVVNCECSMNASMSAKSFVPYGSERHKALNTVFHNRVEVWMKPAKKAFIAGFEKQMDDVLDAFDRTFKD